MNKIKLDVSELEAPDPLVQAIEVLQRLPQDSYLHLVHRMTPCKLYDYLTANSFYSETRKGDSGRCELFICHDNASAVKSLISQLVDGMAPWQE